MLLIRLLLTIVIVTVVILATPPVDSFIQAVFIGFGCGWLAGYIVDIIELYGEKY